jgi:hypothetical protein
MTSLVTIVERTWILTIGDPLEEMFRKQGML